jgi:4-amino-4-deoxychorismate lyase
MSRRCFMGATPLDAWPADDRGVAYGDGVFETMRACDGELPWWDRHWARLVHGAARLRLPLPDPVQVRREAAAALDGGGGVLKLLVSRGPGGRGYAPPTGTVPLWQLSTHPLPERPPGKGLALRWCETRLAVQPLLAGIKHCNRLEQVMARAEWESGALDPAQVQEGLMRSVDGDVVCATAANVFVLRDGRWLTPLIDRCGVAGVCRAWVMQAVDAEETRLQVVDIETADSVFLCNAVRGILPVARLDARCWAPHPSVVALQSRLCADYPAFQLEMS